MAQELGLDLVEVADQANPPVCRVMDYGKFKYEHSQKAKESRKKATRVLVKEMKYRPKIGVGDFATKTRKVEGFLSEGSKVKITIMFRGREMQHPELGRRILDRVVATVAHVGRVEVYPKQEGRNMTMMLSPGQATRRQREAAQAHQAAEAEAVQAHQAAEAEAAEAEAAEAAVEGEAVVEAAETAVEGEAVVEAAETAVEGEAVVEAAEAEVAEAAVEGEAVVEAAEPATGTG